MLFENLPSELLFEIFSFLHPSDLYKTILSLNHVRLLEILCQVDISLDLTGIGRDDFDLICEHLCPSRLIFLRLTNQFCHGLLVRDYFSLRTFHPNQLVRLRSLHLDDIVGDEIDVLPPTLEKLFVKFHKKAKFAIQFYRLALNSSSLKECYLIGGYAFDHQTCFPTYSPTIERLQMAIKSAPKDLATVLHSFPSLIKLKTRIYSQSTGRFQTENIDSSLKYLNIDLQGSGIDLNNLYEQILCHLSHLQSLIYHAYGKCSNDLNELFRLSRQYRRVQFIRKGLPSIGNVKDLQSNFDLVTAVQEMTNAKSSKQVFFLHTMPYPDKLLSLPFSHWNRIDSLINVEQRPRSDQKIYDRVENVRLNLSERWVASNFPLCRHVSQLTLVSNSDYQSYPLVPGRIESQLYLPSIRHLIVNTQLSLLEWNSLFCSMSLTAMEISWSQFSALNCFSKLTNLSLIRECVSWREIQYIVYHLIPRLEHLQMNVTTSEECRLILDVLLTPTTINNLRSIKICICQTLSDQIQRDLQPLFLLPHWIPVKWHMDNWYLYVWK